MADRTCEEDTSCGVGLGSGRVEPVERGWRVGCFSLSLLRVVASTGAKELICTSYYMSTLQYCVYCSRPEGVKRPRASAVSTAILQCGRVVTSLSQNKRSDKFAG